MAGCNSCEEKNLLQRPDYPLYIMLHGNSPTIYKRQGPRNQKRWQITRVPFVRIRPQMAFSGYGDTLDVPEGAYFYYGAEFGVVIGKDARNVSEREAMDYVKGFTCCNDCSTQGLYPDFFNTDYTKWSPYEYHSHDTLCKLWDGDGVLGTHIALKEEIKDPYNLLMYTRFNGRQVDRSFTGSYLMDIEFAVSYLSRCMTLPAGTVISLGAAGWDGLQAKMPQNIGECVDMEVEIENVGSVKTFLRSSGPLDLSDKSSCLSRTERDPSFFHTHTGAEASKSNLWQLRGNYRTRTELEGMPRDMGMCPHLMPYMALGRNEKYISFPANSTNIQCSCELAGVVGPKPVYRVSREDAFDYLEGLAILLTFHDSSFVETISNPTNYESRAAYYLGGCGDGFYQMSESSGIKDMGTRKMTVYDASGRSVTTSTADYIVGLQDALSIITRGSTLMPGDVISLGPAGPKLMFALDRKLTDGFKVGAMIEGLGGVEVIVNDLRTVEARDMEYR